MISWYITGWLARACHVTCWQHAFRVTPCWHADGKLLVRSCVTCYLSSLVCYWSAHVCRRTLWRHVRAGRLVGSVHAMLLVRTHVAHGLRVNHARAFWAGRSLHSRARKLRGYSLQPTRYMSNPPRL